LQAFLEWFTHGSIVVLAVLMVVQWARWRDRASLDIFLVFGLLAVSLVLERTLRLAQIQPEWLRPLGVSVVLAHPYLLLRVVSHFRPISSALRRLAEAGLIVSLLVTWISVWPLPSAGLGAFAFLYFLSLLGYVAWSFREGARAAGGVTHWRMKLAALGALLLAIVFVLAVVLALVPVLRAAMAAFIPLAALGAALSYYFAFAPPPWLRRVWQSSELYGFLAGHALAAGSPTREALLNRLSEFVVPAVGGTGAAAATWDGQQLIVRVSHWGYLEPSRPVPKGRLLEAWRDDRATLVKGYEWVLPGGARGSVYVVPIPCKVAPRGLLFVVLPKAALFVSDDLALLGVCCNETAVQLDNAVMRERQQGLITELAERSEQLTALNKELEAFSYSVSHDLRAPLRHIHGFTELLQKAAGPPLDPTRQRYLRVIAESAVKMGDLIDSLLVFSRMGRAEMMRTHVDLNAIVRSARRDVSQADPARKVTWVLNPLPSVRGDPGMLQLVFTNLLSNAFKYSRNRADAVIEVGHRDGSESEAVVFVKDNGVGFDMAYADRLFGVFQRLHRTEEFEGTGIGLANVQRIVARHGGRVWAEAEPDKGATFYVALPRERPAPPNVTADADALLRPKEHA
jgi:signal transduction histidine kinase